MASGKITKPGKIGPDPEKELIRLAMWASEPIPSEPIEIVLHEVYSKNVEPRRNAENSRKKPRYRLEGFRARHWNGIVLFFSRKLPFYHFSGNLALFGIVHERQKRKRQPSGGSLHVLVNPASNSMKLR